MENFAQKNSTTSNTYPYGNEGMFEKRRAEMFLYEVVDGGVSSGGSSLIIKSHALCSSGAT